MTNIKNELKSLSDMLQDVIGKPFEQQRETYAKAIENLDDGKIACRPLPPLRNVRSGLLAYLIKTKIVTDSTMKRFVETSMGSAGSRLLKGANTQADRMKAYEYGLLMFCYMIEVDKDTNTDTLYLYQPQFRFVAAAMKTFKLKVDANYPAFNEATIPEFETGVGMAINSLHSFMIYNTKLYGLGISRALDQLIGVKPVSDMNDREYNAMVLALYGINAIYSQSCEYNDIQLVALLKQFRPDFLPLITPCLSDPSLPDHIDSYLIYEPDTMTFTVGPLLKAHMMAERQFKRFGEPGELDLVADRADSASALIAMRNSISPALQELQPTSRELLGQITGIHKVLIDEFDKEIAASDEIKANIDRIDQQMNTLCATVQDHPAALERFDIYSVYPPTAIKAKMSALISNKGELEQTLMQVQAHISVLLVERKLNEVNDLTAKLQDTIDSQQADLRDYTVWMIDCGDDLAQMFADLIDKAQPDAEDNEVELLRLANANLHLEINKLGARLSHHGDQVEEMNRQRSQELQNQEAIIAPALRDLLFAKPTLAQVMATFTRLYPDVLLADGFSKEFDQCNYQDPMKLFRFLVILREDYYTGIINGESDGTAKNLFGDSIFRANESATVLNDDRLRRQREFRFDGQDVLMTKHLTIGKMHDPQRTVQVHFDIHDDRLRLGRIGEHLPL